MRNAKIIPTILIITFLQTIFWVFSQPAQAISGSSPDLTPRFTQDASDLKKEELSSFELKFLRQYNILLVPGIVCNMIDQYDFIFGKILRVEGYFRDQRDYFSRADVSLPFVQVPIETQAGAQFNSQIIKEAIEHSSKPVILIGHSKGGVDSLVTLLNWPHLQEKVAMFVSLQAPFMGSPVADLLYQNLMSRFAVDFLARHHGGSLQMLVDLTVKERKRYFHEKQEQIVSLLEKVPTIQYGSWIGRDIYTPFASTRDYLLTLLLPNDGIVPLKSAYLPLETTGVINVQGVDHGVPVLEEKDFPFDRITFTKALLRTIKRHLAYSSGSSAKNR